MIFLPHRSKQGGSLLQELEEMAADMVVWLAGSQKGVNALRLTCTVPGIPLHIVDAAVTRAREAQLDSLASMQINLTRVSLLQAQISGLILLLHK